MLFELVTPYKSISIIGMCKNAGKTTVLNELIAAHRVFDGILALTSIGRDGESTDVVTSTHKPNIYVYENTLVATASGLLKHCDITSEVVATTDMGTPFGDVAVVRAKSDGYIQIGGPSMSQQLIDLNSELMSIGATRVIIDGAISRKSLCAPSVTEATILCTGASYSSSIDKVIEDTKNSAELLMLDETDFWAGEPTARLTFCDDEGNVATYESTPLHEAIKANPEKKHIMHRGAVTDSILKPLFMSATPLQGVEICAQDASKLLISAKTRDKLLLRGCRLSVLNKTVLLAVTVNPISAYGTHFDPVELRVRMKEAVDVPVIDVRSEND